MPEPRPARRLLDSLRTADWLTPERVVAWSIIFLIEELLIVGFLALWQHGVFVEVHNPPSSDFVSFYAAGKLVLAGTPALAYDQAAHYLAQHQAAAGGAGYQYFFYPPVFLLLCAALATLPYFASYALFQVATLVPFILVMRAIVRAEDWRWLPALLAFPAVFWTLGVGQNAFLTAALFGGFTLLIDRRPISAGMLLGLLCYKPHFGLLAPIALLAGRRWRAFGAALVSMAALVGISVLLFGWGTWQAYLHAFAGSNRVYESGAIDLAGIETPFGAARLLGLSAGTAYALQLVCALAMAGLTALIWQRHMSQPLRCASLLAATLLAVPLALMYDKLLLLVAIGWLLREARSHGFLPWEKLVLLLTWPASLVTWVLGTGLHVPLGPAITAAVLILCVRRVWLAQSARPAQAAPSRSEDAQVVGATP
jgi:alpha-1,2-mannosyltransferase